MLVYLCVEAVASAAFSYQQTIEIRVMGKMQNDEIELIELFRTIWGGKWVISTAITLAVFLGFGFLQIIEPKYKISVPVEIDIYPVSDREVCGKNIKCIDDEVRKRLLALLGTDWTRDDDILSMTTPNPLGTFEYEDKFEEAISLLTKAVQNDALNQIALIENEFNDTLLGTETVASVKLNSAQVLQSIDSDQSAASFGLIRIEKISPKDHLILALSVLVGGTVGVFWLRISNTLLNKKTGKTVA
jgi:hypothetical protein